LELEIVQKINLGRVPGIDGGKVDQIAPIHGVIEYRRIQDLIHGLPGGVIILAVQRDKFFHGWLSLLWINQENVFNGILFPFLSSTSVMKIKIKI
jgi:hypothetical protein